MNLTQVEWVKSELKHKNSGDPLLTIGHIFQSYFWICFSIRKTAIIRA
jgi:hypothetical protein